MNTIEWIEIIVVTGIICFLTGYGLGRGDRRKDPPPFGKVALDVLEGLKGGITTKTTDNGFTIITTTNGFMLTVVNGRLLGTQDLSLTNEEEKAICDVIAIRIAMNHACDLKPLFQS